METESHTANRSKTSSKRKRKRCPEAETIESNIPVSIGANATNELEPPRKKQKLSSTKPPSSISDTKEEEETVHFLSNYDSTTLSIQRIRDTKRFDDEEEDDDADPSRVLKFTVLKPPNYVSPSAKENPLLLASPHWVRLSDIFSSAFKYTAQTKPTPNASKKEFIDALELFLKRNCIRHGIDAFYTLFRGRYYISERGFCLLLVIMRDFDEVSHFVQHFCFYRFYYRRRIFGTKIASFNHKKATRSIDDIMICNSCCLEDIERNFNADNPCDCQCVLHMKCNEMAYNAPPDADADAWFCSYCVESGVSREGLMQRRHDFNENGDFEVERVIDYNAVEDEYVVKWKNYPDEACCETELSISFIECVDEFWSKYEGKIPKQAAKAIATLKKENSKQTKEKEKQPAAQPAVEPAVQPASQPEARPEAQPEAQAAVQPAEEVKEQKEEQHVKKFIPAKLTDVMDEKYIIRRQKYTKETYERMRLTTDKHRKWLLKEIKRESAIGMDIIREMQMNGNNHLPKYHLRSVNRDWDCDLPRIRDIIVSFLRRKWSDVDAGEVSCSSFVIGDIIDPENPAKKYGADQGVHSQKAYGLFARERIKKDTLLFEYAGCVKPIGLASKHLDHLETELDQTTLFDLIGHLDVDRRKLFWGKKANDQLVIDPSKWHNEGVYMNDYRDRVMEDPDDDEDDTNHSIASERKQNVKFYEVLVNNWPRVFAVALCDIDGGQELLGDYGDDFWSNFRLMMRRQKQLEQIKKRINDGWETKYKELQNKCKKQQKELQQIKQKQLL